MSKSPEQFDFSKREDQKNFDKLSDDKKQELVERGHKEALKVDKEYNVDKKIAERFGDIKTLNDFLFDCIGGSEMGWDYSSNEVEIKKTDGRKTTDIP